MKIARSAGLTAAALAAATVVSLGLAVPASAPASASATSYPSSAAVGTTLPTGAELVNGSYRLIVQGDGNLVVYRGTSPVWASHTKGASARLSVQRDGNLVLYSGKTVLWLTNTYGSGTADRLSLLGSGALVLSAAHGYAWTDGVGYGCGSRAEAHGIEVDISRQLAWVCSHRQQLLVTAVTTGASSHGDGTPTGTWKIQARIRDTYLYPAAGGRYHVQYWMPYNGAYGMHDSPWQTFPFGSSLYKTEGSHGCVHLPDAVAAWVFNWAPVGSTVSIEA